MCVAVAETHHALRREMHLGKIIPITAGSASHVLLAWSQEAVLKHALQTLLDSSDEQALARSQHLEAAVRRTRRDGFSITIGEREDGASGLAAPVFDAVGALVGAVQISGPTLRMSRETCEGWVEDLLTTAERMTRLNGGRFPTRHRADRVTSSDMGRTAMGRKIVPLNLPPTTLMRAPGEGPVVWLDSAIDELAVALDIDPIELRIRTTRPRRPETCSDRQASRRVLPDRRDPVGWAKRPARGRTEGDPFVGLGTATAVFPALGSRHGRIHAARRRHGRGRDQRRGPGTGLLIVLSLVGADPWTSPDRVTPRLGDSALPPGVCPAVRRPRRARGRPS